MAKRLLFLFLLLLMGASQLANAQSALSERPAVGAEERSLVIFPNPSAGMLHLTASGFIGKTELRILNVIGNVVYRENLNESETRFSRTLDLSELSPGLYYLKLEGDGHSDMRKVVIR